MVGLFKLVLFLVPAGFLAGISSSAAGLASLVSYPALLMVGLSPVMANVTNTYSLLASGFSSIIASKKELAGKKRQVWQILPLSILGVILGALLLFWIPSAIFKKIVPFFIMFAGIMVLVPNIRKTTIRDRQVSLLKKLVVYFGIFLEGIYTGYFGAGGGVVLLALLIAINRQNTFAVNNALKNFTLAFANVIGVFVYLFKASILWKYVIPLAIGLWFGGLVGPRIVRVVSDRKMRIVCCILSWVLGISLFLQTYHLI